MGQGPPGTWIIAFTIMETSFDGISIKWKLIICFERFVALKNIHTYLGMSSKTYLEPPNPSWQWPGPAAKFLP